MFSKRGFDATRVEDIARLAGVAKGSVYTHFKDKEALFQGLIESTLLPLYRQVQEIQRDKTLTLREKSRAPLSRSWTTTVIRNLHE